MKRVIKLVGEKNDLELGYVDDQEIYHPTNLLADSDHRWKILHWIDTELQLGWHIQVVSRFDLEPDEDMMDNSKRKNTKVLRRIVDGAFLNAPDDMKTR